MNTNKMTVKEMAAYNRMHHIEPVKRSMRRNVKAMNELYQNEWM